MSNESKKKEIVVTTTEFDDENFKANLPSFKEAIARMKQFVVGQDEQVKRILTNIYRAYDEDEPTTPKIILLIGKTGSGKSYIAKLVSKILDVAYSQVTATDFSKAGYEGDNVGDIFFNLTEGQTDITKIERGIVFIDEIDKLAGYKDDDVSGSAVYKALLAQMDGRNIKIKAPRKLKNVAMEWSVDTSKMIFILAGAFDKIYDIRDKRLNKKTIGFKIDKDNEEDEISRNIKKKFLKQDIIDFGVIPEFAGRINTIIELNEHTKESLTQILLHSRDSRLLQIRNLLMKKHSIDLDFSMYPSICADIAEQAIKIGTGARELSTSVDFIFEEIFATLYSDEKKYNNTRCILKPGIVADNTRFYWGQRKPRNVYMYLPEKVVKDPNEESTALVVVNNDEGEKSDRLKFK